MKRAWIFALASIFGFGFLFVAQSAWADIAVTCTPFGTGVNAGCVPTNFANTWYISAVGQNEPAGEQTMTLTFPGVNFAQTGVFNILNQSGDTTGLISDQVQLVNHLGFPLLGIQPSADLVFSSSSLTPLSGGMTLATESGGGIVTPLGLYDGVYALVGTDTEVAFNPLGFANADGTPIADTSDFVSIVPEPSTIGLLGPSLAGLMLLTYGSKKKREFFWR